MIKVIGKKIKKKIIFETLFDKDKNINRLTEYIFKYLEDKVFNIHKLQRKYYHVDKIVYMGRTNTILITTKITWKNLKLHPRTSDVEIPYTDLKIMERKEKIKKIQENGRFN